MQLISDGVRGLVVSALKSTKPVVEIGLGFVPEPVFSKFGIIGECRNLGLFI